MQYTINNQVIINIDRNAKPLIRIFEKLNIKKLSKISKENHITIKVIADTPKAEYQYIRNECKYSSNNYFVFDDNGNEIELPFYALNDENTIVRIKAESNPNDIFFYILQPIIRYKMAIKNNTMLLHSSAVKYNDTNIVFPAWGGTGKTNLLLALLHNGADYYSDDYLLFDYNGAIAPYLTHLNLFDYNYKVFPGISKRIAKKNNIASILTNFLSFLQRVNNKTIKRETINKAFKIMIKYSRAVNNNKTPVTCIFPNAKIGSKSEIGIVIMPQLIDIDEPMIESIDLEDIVERMIACHMHEWHRFNTYYYSYLYLSGDAKDILHRLAEKERSILYSGFQKALLYKLKLPIDGLTENNIIPTIDLINNLIAAQ